MRNCLTIAAGAAVTLAWGSVTRAQVSPEVVIETVVVGNPGNAGDARLQGNFGAVAYVYAIGKYEVTVGQYTAFLNAVAATDTYGLYHTRMDYDADPSRNGCNIKRQGAPGSYTYSVAPDWANRPVNFVSWGDAARFANWLHNGQPTGAPDLTTTEDGSYFLNGMTSDEQLEDVVREPDATWGIPTKNEWYKAAYHKNDGVTGNYFNYPMSSNSGPSHGLIDPDPGNHATFSGGTVGDWTIGAPYYRTEVGAHENSASPYGTFDQGGNVQEFNETVPEPDIRGIRGGSWFWGNILGVWDRPLDMHSSDQFDDLGFRVATTVITPPPCDDFVAPDFDHDCDVDLDDFGAFQACASGSAVPVTPGCEDKDFDGDGDGDQADFGILQVCLSGAGIPADPGCAG